MCNNRESLNPDNRLNPEHPQGSAIHSVKNYYRTSSFRMFEVKAQNRTLF
ncbi:hypothetical Protein YC6258_05049 [Gynuella sunshinyii YC6258]|uniref:Uncharacterized protein n=1 Tax=Gynuella sunshinyii YC6258 TaxID=1445510 RepID=A0A0C5W337_9GAMM|nr:hypothetical Protein YC6258_05049 [Gynuella sunshinyii YC6258]